MIASVLMDSFNEFISGAILASSCVIGLFFLRFYRRTRDRFFLMFSLAFFVLGVNRFFLTLAARPNVDASIEEARTYLYIVRLLAFLLILAAIIDKNRSRKTIV